MWEGPQRLDLRRTEAAPHSKSARETEFRERFEFCHLFASQPRAVSGEMPECNLHFEHFVSSSRTLS